LAYTLKEDDDDDDITYKKPSSEAARYEDVRGMEINSCTLFTWASYGSGHLQPVWMLTACELFRPVIKVYIYLKSIGFI
jgi:hypothetical protein